MVLSKEIISTSNIVGSEKSQDTLLKELGMNKETYRQAKKLAELPQEMQELVMSGTINISTASRLIDELYKYISKIFILL